MSVTEIEYLIKSDKMSDVVAGVRSEVERRLSVAKGIRESVEKKTPLGLSRHAHVSGQIDAWEAVQRILDHLVVDPNQPIPEEPKPDPAKELGFRYRIEITDPQDGEILEVFDVFAKANTYNRGAAWVAQVIKRSVPQWDEVIAPEDR